MAFYSRNLLFVHIPKCAGASVIREMQPCMEIRTAICDTDNNHATLDCCKKYLRAEEYDRLHKFTIVRNPWDRASSWFHFRKERLELKQEKEESEVRELHVMQNEGLNRWILEYHDTPWTGTWFKLCHPQSFWLGDDIDTIIKFEDMYDDLQTLGIKLSHHKHKTHNSNSDYRNLYNDEARDLIKRICKEDIDKFNYTFD